MSATPYHEHDVWRGRCPECWRSTRHLAGCPLGVGMGDVERDALERAHERRLLEEARRNPTTDTEKRSTQP